MTTEAAIKQITAQQAESGMSMRDYYAALATVAKCHGLLKAALKLAPKYDIGAPSPISEDNLIEELTPL